MDTISKHNITNKRTAQDSFEEYHGAKDYYSSSHFKEIAKSPLQLRYTMDNGTKETQAMKMGTAIHKILLEGPTLFRESYTYLDKNDVLPYPDKDYRTKANKEARDLFYAHCAANNQICLEEDEFTRIFEIGVKLYDNKYIRMLLSGGQPEVSHYFHCEEYGLDLKIRPDYLSDSKPYYVSVKKTVDASLEGFARQCYNYGTHIKEAFYADYLTKFYDKPYKPVLLAIEEEPPYHYSLYVPDDEFMDVGRHFYKAYLWQIQQCHESGCWPGYEAKADNEATGLTTLSLPEFAKRYIV